MRALHLSPFDTDPHKRREACARSWPMTHAKLWRDLHEIQSFTGEGVEHPEQVRAAMIAAVREAYPPIYEDLSLIIKTPPARLEQVRKARTGAILGMIMEIAVIAA
ncbi:MAG: hypothetical protein WB999_11725, partial [Candidatus Binataceae bacterium]